MGKGKFEYVRFGENEFSNLGCDECENEERVVMFRSPSDHSGLRLCGDCLEDLSDRIDQELQERE